jgi:hypothetical protein
MERVDLSQQVGSVDPNRLTAARAMQEMHNYGLRDARSPTVVSTACDKWTHGKPHRGPQQRAEHCSRGTGARRAVLTQGTRIVAPVVARDSSAMCAPAASFSAKVCLGSLTIFPAPTSANMSVAIAVRSSRFAA